MIAALASLALGGNLLAGFIALLSHRERRALMAAALQANGQPDAARRLAPVTKADTKKQIEMQKEIVESGGVFSAENPWGIQKPLGT